MTISLYSVVAAVMMFVLGFGFSRLISSFKQAAKQSKQTPKEYLFQDAPFWFRRFFDPKLREALIEERELRKIRVLDMVREKETQGNH